MAVNIILKSVSPVNIDFSDKKDFSNKLSETETLLSGVTVGGHTIKETNEIINQQEAWKFTLETAFIKPRISSPLRMEVVCPIGYYFTRPKLLYI